MVSNLGEMEYPTQVLENQVMVYKFPGSPALMDSVKNQEDQYFPVCATFPIIVTINKISG